MIGETEVQRGVTQLFDRGAGFWSDVYRGEDVFSSIHRHRLELAFAAIDRLGLAPGTAVLDVGGGAGLEAVELARRGFTVTVLDPATSMLQRTRERSAAFGMSAQITTIRGDVHQLGFTDAHFGLVVALGVIPWLHSPAAGLREAFRVLRPKGWLLCNADNLLRLNRLLDPRYAPVVSSAARRIRDAVFRARVDQEPRPRAHTRSGFVGMLRKQGFRVESTWTYGFGPFTMLGRPILTDRLGRSVDNRLTRLAEQGAPLLPSIGSQVMVLAARPEHHHK